MDVPCDIRWNQGVIFNVDPMSCNSRIKLSLFAYKALCRKDVIGLRWIRIKDLHISLLCYL